jgi:hypothetical protein
MYESVALLMRVPAAAAAAGDSEHDDFEEDDEEMQLHMAGLVCKH